MIGTVLGSLLWFIIGYSLVFSDSIGGFIGDPRQNFLLRNVPWNDCIPG